jgi:arsenite-transporting ATPase
MVLKEGARAITYLSLFGYPVDAAIVNRILPGIRSDGAGNVQVTEPSADPYLRHLQEIQARYLGDIERDFYPLPILRAGWSDSEMVGIPKLRALAASLFADRDPGQIFFVGQAQQISEEGEDYVLKLPLPHVELNKVKLTKRGDELFVSIGNFKRELLLPAVLAQRNASGATFIDGILQVRFPPAQVQPA